jgi:glycosyltransferase involved in cell wall biosynthesis
MLVIEHSEYKVTHVTINSIENAEFIGLNIGFVIRAIAKKCPNAILVWHDASVKDAVNLERIAKLLNLKRKLISYNPSSNYFSSRIGYIEESPFIKVNKKVTYPTWQMSSCVGAIYTDTLLQFDANIFKDKNFDFALNSIGKHYQPLGLFCYSEPQLLDSEVNYKAVEASNYVLFQFVKQHYKFVWKYLLFLDVFLFERTVLIGPLIQSFFYKNSYYHKPIQFEEATVEGYDLKNNTIDVIIPTIGRKKYLYDVLCDLRNQTHLPNNVIIVEQNGVEGSISDLDFITTEKWPFVIKHTFTHQTGACNARNFALRQVDSDWVFMADDDIRIDFDFIEKGFRVATSFGIDALTFGCYEVNYQKNNELKYTIQWNSFGSGCSIVKIKGNEILMYNKAFEFGYGEDTDYGLQLRNKGIDIVFAPIPELLHLKAAIGGFRTKSKLQWQEDSIQPKPSPTVLLCKLLHQTKEQVLGYKTTLFFKFYKHQNIKNPFHYYTHFKKQWQQSIFWANELKKEA